MTSTKALGTYLQDHLAGATAGSELARKLGSEYTTGPLGGFLSELSRDIDQDKDTLTEVMGSLDISPDVIKQATGWVAEKMTRLKLSDRMTGDPDLTRLMEFEVMSIGIEGKLALWRALIAVADELPGLAGVDLPGLAKRAEHQIAGLEEHRLEAARAALVA
ncbi:hypothetical protein [Sporichthya sp.]|uniref:hypothetical protein n=1 Tax=Sporichthya sp. TaxID=65475 RepID=UPI0017EB00BC|nr:hypothetical protein [Sporichthya sp.]MBA3744262.1 hypothetical protein [Sporichthya sp.]